MNPFSQNTVRIRSDNHTQT